MWSLPSGQTMDGMEITPYRLQQHYQFQVILKPDPGNPQELYLKSLEALGIDPQKHDIRFVEDNWESPALGAWGLGWEVWLDGQGNHPVHLFPAGWRIPGGPGGGGNYLWIGTDCHAASAGAQFPQYSLEPDVSPTGM